MTLYFRIMEVWTKDMRYKPQPSTHPSCHVTILLLYKIYPIVIIVGEN
jgi:hypothetical protein